MGTSLRAELTWRETILRLEPPTGATEAAAVFEFTNRGAATVRITDVRSACGCTVPELERTEVAPGEQGDVRAIYHVGSRSGRQSVTISVSTDEGRSEPYTLELQVSIKANVQIAPRVLMWKLGDALASKAAHLQLVEDFRFVDAVSASEDFIVEVVPGEGSSRELRISPRDTLARRQGSITVRVVRGDAEPESLMLWARVW